MQGGVRRRGKLAGSGEGLADPGTPIALRRDQGVPKRDLEIQLQPAPVVVLRHRVSRPRRAPQVDHRLGHRRAAERGPPGLEPVGRRLVRSAGLREVVGQQLGLGLCRLREALLQHRAIRACSCCRSALQQALIGRVLHQRVLEGVARVGRRAAREHQLGRDQLVQRLAAAPASQTGATAASSS